MCNGLLVGPRGETARATFREAVFEQLYTSANVDLSGGSARLPVQLRWKQLLRDHRPCIRPDEGRDIRGHVVTRVSGDRSPRDAFHSPERRRVSPAVCRQSFEGPRLHDTLVRSNQDFLAALYYPEEDSGDEPRVQPARPLADGLVEDLLAKHGELTPIGSAVSKLPGGAAIGPLAAPVDHSHCVLDQPREDRAVVPDTDSHQLLCVEL